MTFDWNDSNRKHLARHHVTPDEAEQVFGNDPLDLEEQSDEFDGFRYRQLGQTNAGRILVMLSTVRGEMVRIITAWDAPKAFRDFYFQRKGGQYE